MARYTGPKTKISRIFGEPILGNAKWLNAEFSAADILMVTVLRRLEGTGMIEEFPTLSAYIARGEARPAYRRAYADQLAVFRATSPT